MKHKIKKILENTIWWLGVAMIGLVLGVSLQFVRNWMNPAVALPAASSLSGNVALAEGAAGSGGCYTSYSGSCPAPFIDKGSIGSWGVCNYYYGVFGYTIVHFRPPGGNCDDAYWAAWPYHQKGNFGTAHVCCR